MEKRKTRRKAPPSRQTTFAITETNDEKVQKASDESGASRNYIINKALEMYFND